MTEAEHLLGRNELVGKNADERRHEERDEALNAIEPANLRAHSHLGKIRAHTGQIRTPYGKDQEVH